MSKSEHDPLKKLLSKRWAKKHQPIQASAADLHEAVAKARAAYEAASADLPGLDPVVLRFIEGLKTISNAQMACIEAWSAEHKKCVGELGKVRDAFKRIAAAIDAHGRGPEFKLLKDEIEAIIGEHQ